MYVSVGSSCGSGSSNLPSFVLALELKELLNDLIGIDLELI